MFQGGNSASPRRSARLTVPSSPDAATTSLKRKSSFLTPQAVISGSASDSIAKIEKKRQRKASRYAPPSTYAPLPLLPDRLAEDLLVFFIGHNPGVETAQTGDAYAHPSDPFRKLLCSSHHAPKMLRRRRWQDARALFPRPDQHRRRAKS
jgi:thymine-DNA glycosylase